jgi:hypothetical protein
MGSNSPTRRLLGAEREVRRGRTRRDGVHPRWKGSCSFDHTQRLLHLTTAGSSCGGRSGAKDGGGNASTALALVRLTTGKEAQSNGRRFSALTLSTHNMPRAARFYIGLGFDPISRRRGCPRHQFPCRLRMAATMAVCRSERPPGSSAQVTTVTHERSEANSARWTSMGLIAPSCWCVGPR